jgi:hypothetical protein
MNGGGSGGKECGRAEECVSERVAVAKEEKENDAVREGSRRLSWAVVMHEPFQRRYKNSSEARSSAGRLEAI